MSKKIDHEDVAIISEAAQPEVDNIKLADREVIKQRLLSATEPPQQSDDDRQVENEYSKLRYFKGLEQWLKSDMIRLNNAATAEVDIPSQFRIAAQNFISTFPPLSEVDRDEARKAIQYLGFIISSLERHMQTGGSVAGEGLKSVNGAQDLFLALAEKAGHPPRDSLYTFSLWNTGETAITFSGDPQEKLFIDVVAESTDDLDKAAILARKIKDELGEDDLDLLKQIYVYLDRAREQFIRFLKKDEHGQPALTPDFFTNIMRQYNCRWVIEGVEWGGPTAANCAPYIGLDYLIGTSDPKYNEHVLNRLRYMTVEDSELLRQDIANPSIAGKILKKLGLEADSFLEADEDHVASLLVKSGSHFLDLVRTFNDIAEKFSLLSGLHFGLIRKFLIKPTHPEVQPTKSTVVDNSKGTSGMSFDDVLRIREMRRSSLVLRKLKAVALK